MRKARIGVSKLLPQSLGHSKKDYPRMRDCSKKPGPLGTCPEKESYRDTVVLPHTAFDVLR